MSGPFISVGHAKISSVLFATTPETFSRNWVMPFLLSYVVSVSIYLSYALHVFPYETLGESPTNFIKALLKSFLL